MYLASSQRDWSYLNLTILKSYCVFTQVYNKFCLFLYLKEGNCVTVISCVLQEQESELCFKKPLNIKCRCCSLPF